MKTTKVTIEELRHMLTELGDQIEREHGAEIELQSDLFWGMDPDEIIDPNNIPTPRGLGDVSSTVDNLRGWDWSLGTSTPVVWMAELVAALSRTPASR